MTPPPLRHNEPVQSYQTLTLGGGSDNTTSVAMQNGDAGNYGQQQQYGGSGVAMETGQPVLTSTTTISLRQA